MERPAPVGADPIYIAFDTETTGLSPVDDRVLEIGAVSFRLGTDGSGEPIDRFEQLVDPGIPIPPELTLIHGITDSMVYGHPTMASVLPDFLQFLETAGRGASPGDHAATLVHGRPGVLHGTYSYVLQDDDGQTAAVHSVSAGLDYPGVGPEHSYWHDAHRVRYTSVSDAEALDGFHLCGRLEGILPALETSHAVVEAMQIAAKRPKDDVVVVCFSGRGDKDCAEVARLTAKK